MQSFGIKFHLKAVTFLTLLLLAGVQAARVSSTGSSDSILLSSDKVLTLETFRLLPDYVRIKVSIPEIVKRSDRSAPSEVNNSRVRFLVQSSRNSDSVEASATNELPSSFLTRDVSWAPSDEREGKYLLPLGIGKTKISLRVTEVPTELLDSRVDVYLQPPLSFKDSMPNYGWLAWFYLWPIPAAVLALYWAFIAIGLLLKLSKRVA